MAVISTPGTAAKPVALPISKGLLWLLGATLPAVAVYYFVGVDQGATSVFGKSMVIHEFVHDARHFLGSGTPTATSSIPASRRTCCSASGCTRSRPRPSCGGPSG
jgi:hypothetical protein